MVRQAAPIDIEAIPGLSALIEEIGRTGAAKPIQRNGKTVAMLTGLRPPRARRRRFTLVDTSELPPVPPSTIEELLQPRPPVGSRSFSSDEIASALEDDRAERWRRKSE